MKTTTLFSTGLLFALFSVRVLVATELVADRNPEPDTARQSVGQDTARHAQADAILQAALAAAKDGLPADKPSGRLAEPVPTSANPDAAAAQATYSVRVAFFPENTTDLDAWLALTLSGIDDSDAAIAAGKKWGQHVAQAVLTEQGNASSRSTASFAESVQSSPIPAPVSVVRAEQAAIGPGRYRYTVLAGTPGAYGYVDNTGTKARFDNLGGIATDAAGTVYVSERNMCTIRKISPDGAVITFAGAPGQSGSQDGAGAAARFNGPSGLAVDATGNVYVADTGNQLIRKIDPAGNVTTLAGKAGEPGSADGSRDSARFFNPDFLAVDTAGNVFVAEYKNYTPLAKHQIRKIAPDGAVSTLAMTFPSYFSFYLEVLPNAISVDHVGNLYVVYTDSWGEFSQVVEFVPAANGSYEGSTIEPPSSTRYWSYASSLALDGDDNLYVKYEGESICRFAPDGDIQVRYEFGNTGGYFWNGMTVDKSGRIYTLSYPNYPEKAGTIEVGTFDPTADGLAITHQPFDDVVNIAQPASMSLGVRAVGVATLHYQWYFNASPVPGATEDHLYLKNIQASDAGIYSVVVTDATSSVSSRLAKVTTVGTPSSGSGNGTYVPLETSSANAAPASSGGGGFHPVTSLAIFLLLAAAALRGRRTFNVAAAGTPGMKEHA